MNPYTTLYDLKKKTTKDFLWWIASKGFPEGELLEDSVKRYLKTLQ